MSRSIFIIIFQEEYKGPKSKILIRGAPKSLQTHFVIDVLILFFGLCTAVHERFKDFLVDYGKLENKSTFFFFSSLTIAIENC